MLSLSRLTRATFRCDFPELLRATNVLEFFRAESLTFSAPGGGDHDKRQANALIFDCRMRGPFQITIETLRLRQSTLQ